VFSADDTSPFRHFVGGVVRNAAVTLAHWVLPFDMLK